MKLGQIIENLEGFCPGTFAQDWDNVGLQVGSSGQDVQVLMLAVDASSEVIRQAEEKGADLLLTHHPLLFKGVKHVTDDDHVGKRILRLSRRGIACFAMHTNFDVLGLADAAADALKLLDREVLEVTYVDDVSREGLGRIGKLPTYMTLEEVGAYVQDVFQIPHVRVYGDRKQPIVSAAILPGAGGGEIDLAMKGGADVMITGDISHHTGLDAVEKGIAVIDATHYGLEKMFCPYMEDYLRKELPDLTVIKAEEKEPFWEL